MNPVLIEPRMTSRLFEQHFAGVRLHEMASPLASLLKDGFVSPAASLRASYAKRPMRPQFGLGSLHDVPWRQIVRIQLARDGTM